MLATAVALDHEGAPAKLQEEGGGRVLATRLYGMTDDPGMKEMLAFLIARDTMHQNQWMAVLEELKDMGMPAPSDFPQEKEAQEFSYEFFVHSDGEVPRDARWTHGSSVDSHGRFGQGRGDAMSGRGSPARPPPSVSPSAE